MCCTWSAHNCAQATWAYMLETVPRAVRRFLKSQFVPLNVIIIDIIIVVIWMWLLLILLLLLSLLLQLTNKQRHKTNWLTGWWSEPASEKVEEEQEPRYLEDEGFYVGVRPVVATRNKNKMENRLLREPGKVGFFSGCLCVCVCVCVCVFVCVWESVCGYVFMCLYVTCLWECLWVFVYAFVCCVGVFVCVCVCTCKGSIGNMTVRTQSMF